MNFDNFQVRRKNEDLYHETEYGDMTADDWAEYERRQLWER